MKKNLSFYSVPRITLVCLREKCNHLLWLFVTLTLLLGSGVQASGQSKMVRGRITGTDEMPLPGVNISVKGTLKGVVSNAECAYSV